APGARDFDAVVHGCPGRHPYRPVRVDDGAHPHRLRRSRSPWQQPKDDEAATPGDSPGPRHADLGSPDQQRQIDDNEQADPQTVDMPRKFEELVPHEAARRRQAAMTSEMGGRRLKAGQAHDPRDVLDLETMVPSDEI